MAKDYFQDIVPPGDNSPRPHSSSAQTTVTPIPIRTSPPPRPLASVPLPEGMHEEDTPIPAAPERGERSIRNIPSSRPRMRPMSEIRDGREASLGGMGAPRRPRATKWWLWIIAGISVAVLAVLLFIALRPTTITVVPRSRPVTFSDSSLFTAYPSSSASGTLAYMVQTSDTEDSEVVASQGTVRTVDKASGIITVYNDLQTTPLRLIKSTRFESADGHVFRAPAEVVVPSKVGTVPGQISVTVVADQPGEAYNVAASRFTLPGLKSSAASYAHVYARSTASMTGGFIGNKPGVAPGALESARALVRSRLEGKARAAATWSGSQVSFPDLVQITYQDLPNTTEAGGGVRVHESAHVSTPVFAADRFALAVATAVSADAGSQSVKLVQGTGLSAHLSQATTTLGVDPLQFRMAGMAQLIWNVDSTALAQALAGKDRNVFQAVVATFPSIQEAHARIEPFWKSTFPSDQKAIKIVIEAPKA